jgi:predicted XRE-type DNA-binding protein
MRKKGHDTGSRNEFKDLGVPNADEHLVKAKLVFKIDTLMKERGLKQGEVAGLFGIRRPDVSKMLRGEFRQFSVERLLRFLVALNQELQPTRWGGTPPGGDINPAEPAAKSF